MTRHIHTDSRAKAWEVVDSLMPCDYLPAVTSAGYPVYVGTQGHTICDLNTSLEVNFDNGETVKVWIDKKEPTFARTDAIVLQSGGKRFHLKKESVWTCKEIDGFQAPTADLEERLVDTFGDNLMVYDNNESYYQFVNGTLAKCGNIYE